LIVSAAGDLAFGGATADPLASGAVAGSGVGALLTGDVRFVNLEGPLCERCADTGLDSDGAPLPGATVRFGVPAAVDVASLANNHALDQGEAGRDQTVRVLSSHHIATAWAGRDAELVRGGRRVIVVARDFAPDADLDANDALVSSVRAARTRGSVLVSLHWGHTGSLLPTPAQRRLGARLIDAGATAVLGHGPHTLQGLERHGRGIIAYSLGNLAFGCRCTDAADAYVLNFQVAPDGSAEEIRALPIVAGLRRPVAASHDAGLVELIETLSRDLGATTARDGSTVLIR
jgi:poly-gamma-glutamate capsule biosynthesis protein CapA/YwtB (metallophosphatase superfamily)